jgi:hypothetical protein
MAVDYGKLNNQRIRLFGFGILGQGFYSMDIPEAQTKLNQAIGLLTVLEGSANEDKLNEELKLLVSEKWDFQPRKVDVNEYLVIFPNKGTLETSRFASFGLSIYNMNVKISKSSLDPDTSSMLKTY